MRQEHATESAAKENAMLVGTLFLVLLLVSALIFGPFLLAHYFGVWFGLITAVVAIPAWIYLGPRPTSGFGSGIICLFGLAGLIGALIVWIFRIIRYVAA